MLFLGAGGNPGLVFPQPPSGSMVMLTRLKSRRTLIIHDVLVEAPVRAFVCMCVCVCVCMRTQAPPYACSHHTLWDSRTWGLTGVQRLCAAFVLNAGYTQTHAHIYIYSTYHMHP